MLLSKGPSGICPILGLGKPLVNLLPQDKGWENSHARKWDAATLSSSISQKPVMWPHVPVRKDAGVQCSPIDIL